MKDDFGFLVFLAIATIIAFLSGMSIGVNDIRKQAVKHGAAQYNPTTAQFEWRDK